jgi:hypothetical protein
LELRRDAVKVFLLVFIDMSKERGAVLVEVFQNEEIVEGEVRAGFTSAICSNGVVKDFKMLKGGGEMGANNGVEIGIQVLEDGYGTFVSGVWFVDESTASGF